MAITTIDAVIRMRRGLEDDLDITKLQVGEWALSTDKKWVRICYAPSHVIKIASQEAMDETLEEIRGILNTIEGIEDIVEGYKNSAEGSATNASSSASAAASSATASANSATLSQSWAVGGTGTRSGENTNNSKYYAEQARQYTPEGYQDFVDDINHLKDVAADKALTPTNAVITNGVAEFETLDESRIKGLVVEIKPDQDLHGYTKPWPAGAGKNKCPSITTQVIAGRTWTVGDDGVITITGTTTGNCYKTINFSLPAGTYTVSGGDPNGVSGTGDEYVQVDGVVVARSYGSINQNFTLSETKTVTLAMRDFQTSGQSATHVFKPMVCLSAASNPTSFEPYENKCPIYGHDKCDIDDVGKNKLPLPTAGTQNGVTLAHNADGSVTLTGTATSTTYFDFFAGDFDSTTYAGYLFRADSEYTSWGASTLLFRISGSDRAQLQSLGGNSDIAINDNGNGLYFAIRVANGFAIPSGGITIYPMLRKASDTDSTFVPYRYQKVTISLGDTIYGGTLDVLKGVLTITYSILEYDGSSDEGWYKISGENRYYTPKPVDVSTHLEGTISNNFKFYGNQAAGVPDGQFYIGASNLGVRLDSITSVADWKTFLSNNLMQIVYPLATAIVIQLNPTVMKTLLGENNLSASTGDILSCIYTAMMNSDDVPTLEEKTALDGFTTITGGLLSSLKVSLSPNQDLHGYDSPWVGGAGKNKANVIQGNCTEYGIINPSDSSRLCNEDYLSVSEGQIFTLSCENLTVPTKQVFVRFFEEKGNLNSRTTDSWTNFPYTFTVQQGEKYVQCVYRNSDNTSISISDLKVQLELGSTATDYEPYSNICPISGHTEVDIDVSDGDTTQEQVTVNLGGTYYSGTLDVVSGVLTVDKVGVSMDGSESWNTHGAISHGFYCDNVIPSGLLMDSAKDDTAISNEYNQNRYDVATSMDNGKFAYGLTGGTVRRFILRDDRFSTVADLTTALGTTNLQLVMELATPTPIQLSPTMVKALVGENHLSAPLDGQEITEVKFREGFTFDDVVKYVQSMLTGADE